jgi:glycine/D-amino acid oxidase-like deaminating enzyme
MSMTESSPYGAKAYWRATAGDRPVFEPKRRGAQYDVAIIGAGFHGLWTAYHLLKEEPSLAIALIDQQHVGFGATGRNGGFASTKVGMRVEDLERKYGGPATHDVLRAMARQIDDLVATIRAEEIDAEVDYGGLLIVATNKSQQKRLTREFRAIERIGLETMSLLSVEDVRARVDSPTYLGGIHDPHCAVLHPLKLARGLAKVCAGRGLDIYEDMRVDRVVATSDGMLVNSGATQLRARKVVATLNAWAGEFRPAFRRTVLPVYTYILMTEPLSDAQWQTLGWSGREGIEDSRLHLHFYRRTRDGRILWGGSDNRVPFLGRIGKRHDANEWSFQRLTSTFRSTFPTLAGVKFEYRWGGAFAVTPDFLPHYGIAEAGHLIYGHGCCGHGVGLSYLGGQIMRDLIQERRSETERLLFMRPDHGAFPPEPLRSIGGSLTLQESRWFDDAQAKGISPAQEPLLLRLAPKWFA